MRRHCNQANAPNADMPLTLYRRDRCALCDLAASLLAARGRVPDQVCFLEDDASAEQRYGWRIPVLRRGDTGAELDWPFDAYKLGQFLGEAE